MEYQSIPAHFSIHTEPIANPQAVITSGKARFTLLTPRIIRMEWSPTTTFEDRPSQAFWFRKQPRPHFTREQNAGTLKLETEYLTLSYKTGHPFSPESLQISLNTHGGTWHFNSPNPGNLRGTARTLDMVDGAVPLGEGLISRSGWSLVDDSASLVFNQHSWLEARQAPEGQLDLYFFGFGTDYPACLREFNLIAGSVPMVPRFILGNWWSRFWEYSQDELARLMDDFQHQQVPLSVCIIDMDWHITKTGNTSTGWTGYTWNSQLFPNPEALLQQLHQKNLKVALNLHPAEGIHPHEEDYQSMAAAVGQDPAHKQPVEFDITNPAFVNAYFNILHHPQEESGIDFWWMDWQQGARTRLSGLDPLWWLNHLHFLDLGRNGTRRSFIFSRWGGLGNHRYPIGFSGDSIVSWASLAFQPYFTATAANVNYGWWSHDIGGHMGGVEDAELYARWVQMGVFQPILRLHSTKNPYHERRPWGWDAETLEVTRAAMQMRHALIPYLYSMAWRCHHEGIAPILPMYYSHPQQAEAYACPNQYMFGSQLLTTFYTQPRDPHTRLSRAVVWLPEGGWYDYFTGQYYNSGWHALHGGLRNTPVFARAGAIIPTAPASGSASTENPAELHIHIFAGQSGSFDLYEDEGNTNFYQRGDYAITPMCNTCEGNQFTFSHGPAQGQTSLMPATRRLHLHFRGFNQNGIISARLNGEPLELQMRFEEATHTISLDPISVTPADRLEVRLAALSGKSLANFGDSREARLHNMVDAFRMESNAKLYLRKSLPDLLINPGGLEVHAATLSHSQMRALFEVLCQAGVDYSTSTGRPVITLWNSQADKQVSFLSSTQHISEWWKYITPLPCESGICPAFKSIEVEQSFTPGSPWLVQLSYYGLHQQRFGNRQA